MLIITADQDSNNMQRPKEDLRNIPLPPTLDCSVAYVLGGLVEPASGPGTASTVVAGLVVDKPAIEDIHRMQLAGALGEEADIDTMRIAADLHWTEYFMQEMKRNHASGIIHPLMYAVKSPPEEYNCLFARRSRNPVGTPAKRWHPLGKSWVGIVQCMDRGDDSPPHSRGWVEVLRNNRIILTLVGSGVVHRSSDTHWKAPRDSLPRWPVAPPPASLSAGPDPEYTLYAGTINSVSFPLKLFCMRWSG
ncbi:uncharacterized protein BO96DRAFT_394664 [Aspergillus niger CBS 101883]|uniref:Uncharacterized protein n=3 Tax=Aspergillus niger TaxID=5061 RepID=A2R9V6_ASPNC|nr:uncharacterized protein BO96DRAFT_394664 [Aspergillus niger CBS 101883]XP_059602865.1 hypothetical protein An18g00360 [Aspergillus niger]PYH55754.1 hypothetical protein BO96DRAFT_394664 [Aspergillus niger CBS 101883]RDH14474.1 hypothetical protein M747DRAFT_290510 [Aspergillus niger ATCC 13496]CAK43112.1 hypothetical protein An18g00360 [Aspergillus niger]